MLFAASESAVTKKPRLRLTSRRSSSVRPFGSFHSAMSRDMFTSCGIQWLAQVARYFSQAHLYLKGTSWLTSVRPLMIRLSATLTRLKSGACTVAAGRSAFPTGCSPGASAAGVTLLSHASIVRVSCSFPVTCLLAGLAISEPCVTRFEQAGLAVELNRCRFAVGGDRVELPGTRRRGFLRVRRPDRAQVIRRLQSALPRELVGFVELLARSSRHVDIQRLRLVDPLLAPGRALDQPARLDLERGRVELPQFG